MHNITRRSLIAYGLVGAQGLLAACGGSEGGSQATAATSETATPAPSPTTGGTSGPTTAPAPAPATSSPAPAPASTAAVAWDVGPALRLVADASTTFDLSITLPATVKRGGVFKLAAGSAALPAGVTLDASGILKAGASTDAITIAGLTFTYDEP